MFGYGKNMKVILYDEDKMECFGGYLSEITIGKQLEIDVTNLKCSNERFVRGIADNTAEIVNKLNHEIIQLHPTTMKRIARHNLEKENHGLLKEIEKNKKEIEDLKKLYKTLQERLQTITDIGSNIWENGTKYTEKKEYEESDWNDYD